MPAGDRAGLDSDASFAQGLATADLSMSGGGTTLEGEGWMESPVRAGVPSTTGDEWEVMPPTPARGLDDQEDAKVDTDEDPDSDIEEEGEPPETADANDDDTVSQAPPASRAAGPSRPKPKRKSGGFMCCAARQPKEAPRRQPMQPSTTSQLAESSDENEDEGEIELDLTVPEDVDGTTLEYTLPNGTVIEVDIPEGLGPGDKFQAFVHMDDMDAGDEDAKALSGSEPEGDEGAQDDTTLAQGDDEAPITDVAAADLWEARHDFLPARATDLALTSGDLVVVTMQDPAKTWWKGFRYDDLDKREGDFPSNYVEPLEEEEIHELLGLEIDDEQLPYDETEQSARLVGWSDGKKVEQVRLRRKPSGFGVAVDERCVVIKLEGGGSAEAAGIRVGDTLRCVDSKPVNSYSEVTALLAAVTDPGATVELDVVRVPEPEPELQAGKPSGPALPNRVISQQQADEMLVASEPRPPAPLSPRSQVIQMQEDEEREVSANLSAKSSKPDQLKDFYSQLKTAKSPPARPSLSSAAPARSFSKEDFNLSETSEEEDLSLSTESDHHASLEHLERLAERTAALQKTREAERQRLIAQVAEMEAATRTKHAEVSKLERKVQQLEHGLSEKERDAGESTSRTRTLERALVAAEASTVEQEEKVTQLSAQLKKQAEDNKALKAKADKLAGQLQSQAASIAVDTEALEAEALQLRDTNRTLEVKCQTLNNRLRESDEGRQREQEKIAAERMSLEVAQEK
jgi:hypothetical protein